MCTRLSSALAVLSLLLLAAPLAAADPEPPANADAVATAVVKAEVPPASGAVKPVLTTTATTATTATTTTMATSVSFGFQGPATGLALPREDVTRFEGFGGGAARPCAPADEALEEIEEVEEAAPEAGTAVRRRVVRETVVLDDGPPRRPVDGYNPVDPDTACFTNHYSVCRTRSGCCSSCSSNCCDPGDRCSSCDDGCTCVRTCRPRYVRRVYCRPACYRPVVYVRPACGYGWGGYGWGGCGWGGGGWGGGGWGGCGWGGCGWRGGWGWGLRAGWGGCW